MTKYVYTPTEFFGEKGNRINILFYRATSDFAGMFWPKDLYSDADAQKHFGYRSNETNVFYMNIDSAISATKQAYATTFTKGTLSHEFQHMCNTHYFYFGGGEYKEREMDSWANEFCSTTAESIFADQYSIYVPYLNADAGTDANRKAYSRGQTDFLHWDNDFTQYATASLLGGYILSQLPEASRPAFIQTFLKDTFSEDPTPTSYNGSQSQTSYRGSVEDLILTLQDVGFPATAAGTGWVSASVGGGDANFATDWAIVMKGFISALTGKNGSYNQYLKDVTSTENKSKVPAPSIPLAPVTTTTVSLKASAFLVGKTEVDNLSSIDIKDAKALGAHPAYVIVWNGLIPSPAKIGATANDLPAGTTNFPVGAILKPEYPAPLSRSLPDYGFGFNRTNSRPAESGYSAAFRGASPVQPSSRTDDIPGAGSASNPSDGGSGYLSCVYVAR